MVCTDKIEHLFLLVTSIFITYFSPYCYLYAFYVFEISHVCMYTYVSISQFKVTKIQNKQGLNLIVMQKEREQGIRFMDERTFWHRRV